MCGIHGFNYRNANLLGEMLEKARHRGPDGSGDFFDDHLSLGHNLLYITDEPNNSKQPWVLEEGKYSLVYNGEIYNYKALRKKLADCGEKFFTDCDTEVLAAGLKRYGERFIKELEGMYAFAWFDKKQQTLLLARDPSGIKPLYYYNKNERFIFSSEIGSILVHDIPRILNQEAAGIYLQVGYVPGPYTLIQDVRKLVPGEILLFSLTKKSIVRQEQHFRSIPEAERTFNPGEYHKEFKSAVEQCMMGIRTFGLYLSGGLDSSAILHEVSELGYKPQTLSTCFETKKDNFNEDALCARELSKFYGTKHEEVYITEADFINAIEPTYQALEEPRYNRSTPAYYIACKAMASTGTIITLSGDGGDEMLAGYPHHALIGSGVTGGLKEMIVNAIRKPRTIFNKKNDVIRTWCNVLKFPRLPREIEQQAHLEDYMKSWLDFDNISKDQVNNQLFVEQLAWLPEDALIRNDKLGMHFGMEARFPFLTRSFIRYAMSLPYKEKCKDNITKYVVRATYKGILPEYILNKKKSGWATPTDIWYKEGRLRGFIEEVLNSSYYQPLFDLPFFSNIAGDRRHIKILFSCLYLQVWARQLKISV